MADSGISQKNNDLMAFHDWFRAMFIPFSQPAAHCNSDTFLNECATQSDHADLCLPRWTTKLKLVNSLNMLVT